ncbi:MAG: hypothetical protein WAT35_16310 [Tabrizicola sp.]|nr:hypothetical protein [Tabrizicola sp.]
MVLEGADAGGQSPRVSVSFGSRRAIAKVLATRRMALTAPGKPEDKPTD